MVERASFRSVSSSGAGEQAHSAPQNAGLSWDPGVARLRRSLSPSDFARMNIPEEFWKVRIQGVPESIRGNIERYMVRFDDLRDKGVGIFLTGPVGVGKTAIASLVLKEARSRGYTAYFTGVWELREAVKAKVSFDDSSSILDRCRDVDVLVLDNLREEDDKEYVVNVRSLEDIIAYRKSKKRPTIITTRIPIADVRSKFPALFDATVGALVPVAVVGENQRVKEHQALIKELSGSR
jgi:DNA replication protein DnaC